MSDASDPHFFDRMNALVKLANHQCADASADQVSHAFINASSRFNVWLWAVTSADVNDMKSRREEALKILMQETYDSFNRQFDEYAANFDEYMKDSIRMVPGTTMTRAPRE